MAQKWRMSRYGTRNRRPPLDEQALRELALAYVSRFATTRVRLCRYLDRKLRERGWEGEQEPDLEALAESFSAQGYVDDGAYARMKGSAMERRGLGVARIRSALVADGVDEVECRKVEDKATETRWETAEILARKRRIGPYAAQIPDMRQRERQLAMFLRAGHDFATARAWVDAVPGEFPERSD